MDSRTWQSTPERGARAGYDGAKRKRGRQVHLVVDTLGHWLTLQVTPANEQNREQVEKLAEQLQALTGESVELAFVEQGDTGEPPIQDAAQRAIQLAVVKLPKAKKGFVRLPRRWAVERRFAWVASFRRAGHSCSQHLQRESARR